MRRLLQLNEKFLSSYNTSFITNQRYDNLNYVMRIGRDRHGIIDRIANGKLNHYDRDYAGYILDPLKGHVLDSELLPPLGELTLSHMWSLELNSFLTTAETAVSSRVPSQIYPVAVRYITPNGMVCVERPPVQIDVEYRPQGTKANLAPVKIWIPWSITFFNPVSPSLFWMFFSSKSLSSGQDRYTSSIYPNSYNDGHMCFSTSLEGVNKNKTTEELQDIRFQFSSAYAEFFNGGWNADLSPMLYYIGAGFLNCNKEVRDKFPMLQHFFSFTQADLKKFYPNLKSTKIVSYNLRDTYSRSSRNDIFVSLLYTLSTLTLEQTLQFHHELDLYAQENRAGEFGSYSFENLIRRIDPLARLDEDEYDDYDPDNDYEDDYPSTQSQTVPLSASAPHQIPDAMYNSFSQTSGLTFNYDQSGLHYKAQILFDSSDRIVLEEFMKRAAYKEKNYEGYISSLHAGLDQNQRLAFDSIVNDLLERKPKYSNGEIIVYVLDLATGNFQSQLLKNQTNLIKWYSEYLKVNHTTPLVTAEKAAAV